VPFVSVAAVFQFFVGKLTPLSYEYKKEGLPPYFVLFFVGVVVELV
jgi:hypothetical protein